MRAAEWTGTPDGRTLRVEWDDNDGHAEWHWRLGPAGRPVYGKRLFVHADGSTRVSDDGRVEFTSRGGGRPARRMNSCTAGGTPAATVREFMYGGRDAPGRPDRASRARCLIGEYEWDDAGRMTAA